MITLTQDELNYLRMGLKLVIASLDDNLQTIEQLKNQQETKTRRRRFAGECRVIRLEDRRGGARP